MPARNLHFTQGQYYHIYNRSTDGTSLFRDDADYIGFLCRLKKNCHAMDVAVIVYCLLPGHFHLLTRQDGDCPLGRAVQFTCNGYAQRSNHRYQRTGTLFEGRFKARCVTTTEHLRHLCRYIHCNPVKDGFALLPELWPYSNYLEWLGRRNGVLVDQEFISDHFPQPGSYEQFLKQYPHNSARIPQNLRNYLAALEL
jgi:putative transposase